MRISDFNAAKEQLIVAQAQVRAAELALQASQDRYTAGASTLVELTEARATQVQAASSLVFARYNLQFQRMLMDYYTGDLDPAQPRQRPVSDSGLQTREADASAAASRASVSMLLPVARLQRRRPA